MNAAHGHKDFMDGGVEGQMKRFSLWFRCVIACVVLCTFFPVKLFSCMRSMAEVKVPPNFRIFVLHEKQALPGMQIAVYDTTDTYAEGAEKPILRINTGSDGGVQINDLSPGKYIVQTEGPGQGDAVYAIVSDKLEKPDTEILLQ